jgi:hypothetical protein
VVQFLGSLFRNESARLAEMPASWWYDSQLNYALGSLQSRLRVTKKAFELVWPIGARKLAAEDCALIHQYMSDPAVNYIVVPINTGIHWYPLCFRREPGADIEWCAYELETKTDGSCGSDTVRQVARFLDQDSDLLVRSATSQMQAVTKSLAQIDAFDFNLARLADLTTPGSKKALIKLTAETSRLFKQFNPADQAKRIQRLYDSGLSEKPEVAALIAQCLS